MRRGLTEATLADVCSLVTDGTHDTPKKVPAGFPLIKAKEIVGGQIDFLNCDQISDADHRKIIARSKPEFGDTLFTHIGASLGAAAFVNTRLAFSIKNIALFKPNPDIIDARYLYYLVVSPDFQSLAIGTKTGSAQPFLGLSQLRGHRIKYQADLGLQRKIAGILSAYDELIENSQRRIKILETMARALYREWFVHFRFPGHESVPRVPSPLGEIPRGGEVKKLGGISSYINRGITPRYDEEGPSIVINQKCVRDQRLNLEPARRQSKSIPSEKQVCLGDVLINSTGVGTLGRVAQVYEDICDCTVDTHVTIARAARDIDLDFYGCCLLNLQDTFERLGVGATGQTELGRSAISDIEIIVPPEHLQRQFGNAVQRMRLATVTYAKQVQNLRRTRDLLLPRLLSGQIDVEALPA